MIYEVWGKAPEEKEVELQFTLPLHYLAEDAREYLEEEGYTDVEVISLKEPWHKEAPHE